MNNQNKDLDNNDELLYIKNIENMKSLYTSLKEKGDIKNKIREIYKDPDKYDVLLYEKVCKTIVQNIQNLQNNQKKYTNKVYNIQHNKECKQKKYKLNMNGIDLSLDCVIGWKAIFDVCMPKAEDKDDEEKFNKFIKAYEIIRNPEYAGHLIWPVHTIPTINTQRFQQFNDRVDYTLFDIKKYFEKREELKILELSENLKTFKLGDVFLSNTFIWLNQFEDFKEFIDIMNLNCWCDKNYEVKDISKNDGTTIGSYLGDNKTDYPITKDYINNMIEIISGGEKKDIL